MSHSILDIWGEGRIDNGDLVVGFFPDDADNLNLKGATISSGPDKGKPVLNLIAVDSFDSATFPVKDSSYQYLTHMNAAHNISRDQAGVMCRILQKSDSSRVFLYSPNYLVLSTFMNVAGHYQPRLEGTMQHLKDLPSPFNQIKLEKDVVWVFKIVPDVL